MVFLVKKEIQEALANFDRMEYTKCIKILEDHKKQINIDSFHFTPSFNALVYNLDFIQRYIRTTIKNLETSSGEISNELIFIQMQINSELKTLIQRYRKILQSASEIDKIVTKIEGNTK